MRTCRRINELRSDTHAIVGAADATFKDIPHPKFATNLPDIGRFALVLEARVAGDDEQLGEPGELRYNVLRDAVAEVILVGVATQVCEGKDRYRRFVR
jgi:hypothetical protein